MLSKDTEMKHTKKLTITLIGLAVLVNTISVDAAVRYGIRRFTSGTLTPTSLQAVPTFFPSVRNCATKFQPWKNLPMDATVRDVRYDETFKILLGEEGREHRPISFLNAVFAPKVTDDKIKEIKYLDGSLNSAVDRTLHFDVKIEALCETFNGHRFIIEMQKARIPGHMNRWVYYGARELAMVGERNYKRALEIKNSEDRKKAHARHYQRLDPVKVITLLDFDNEVAAGELCNGKDVIVHWDICERGSKNISSNLLSWTYVMLPRFLKTLKKNDPLDFRGRPLEAWLYLMTREDEEQVRVTANMTNNDPALAEGFHRIAHLSQNEKEALHAGKMAYMSRMSREEEQFAEGVVKGKIEILIDDGQPNDQILKRLQLKHPSLSLKQIEKIRDGIKSETE